MGVRISLNASAEQIWAKTLTVSPGKTSRAGKCTSNLRFCSPFVSVVCSSSKSSPSCFACDLYIAFVACEGRRRFSDRLLVIAAVALYNKGSGGGAAAAISFRFADIPGFVPGKDADGEAKPVTVTDIWGGNRSSVTGGGFIAFGVPEHGTAFLTIEV
jgi:hypothetical protein